MSNLPLGVVLYGKDDAADGLLEAFARNLIKDRVNVAGLVQINGEKRCADKQMALEDLMTGRLTNICQDLGPGAGSSCRIDPFAVSEAASLLRLGVNDATELVILNKFGKLEAEGGGLMDEIIARVNTQQPLLIGVSDKFLTAWNSFAQGLDQQIPCTLDALQNWWANVKSRPLTR